MLRHLFHKLAGAAGSFGYDRVSAAASEAEAESQHYLDHGAESPEAFIAKCRAVVETSRNELLGTTKPHDTRNTRASILLVAANSGAAAEALQDCGYAAQCVHSIDEACAAIDDDAPDLLIVSASLPDGSGYDLIDRLRMTAHGNRASIIMLDESATRLPAALPAVQRNVNATLPLPIDVEMLAAAARTQIERRLGRTPNVLSVGFTADQCESIGCILESVGYRLRVCERPTDFDADFDAFEPELILASATLGAPSAKDLIRYVRLISTPGTVPVILIGTRESKARAPSVLRPRTMP
jgi:DNA-binding response OmpR family regulator